MVTTDEDVAYAFQAVDFNFTDDVNADDELASVTIVTLPGAGTLALDGTEVTANQEVTRAQLDAGQLTYTPPPNANGTGYASFIFKVSDGVYESAAAYAMTIDGTPVVDPVTGEPAISGTAQVGYTLTADTSAITGNGMPGEFSYPWIVVDGGTETDIDGATSSTYTLSSADAGKKIKVRVSFADDAGENQQVTSAATPAVAAADAEKATGKIDWVHYTLSRDGDTASAVIVPVTFEGFADSDWNLDAARCTHQAKFEVGDATATLSVRLARAPQPRLLQHGDAERHAHRATRRMAAS